jgi:hypothetical protein
MVRPQRPDRTGGCPRDAGPKIPTRPNSGFSLDAAVRVGAHDRAGLERLLCDCARPPFAPDHLELVDEQQVIDRLPWTQRDGTTALSLTPLELIEHLAAQLVHRVAATPAPPSSGPRRTSAQLAPAGGGRRLGA